jgi:cell division GTPase FtsZ
LDYKEYTLKERSVKKLNQTAHSIVKSMLGDNVLNLHGIVIMGLGDVGNNIVSRIHRSRVSGADTIAVNTDIERLNVSQAYKRILIGKALKGGLGAGGCPTMGRRAAERGITIIMRYPQQERIQRYFLVSRPGRTIYCSIHLDIVICIIEVV